MSTNKCWGEGHDHFHEFTVYLIISIAQDTSGFFSCQGTLLPHVQLAVYQNPRFFFAELLPSCAVLRLYYCHRLFLPVCRASYLPLMNFQRFLLVHSSGLSRSLWKATLSSSVIDTIWCPLEVWVHSLTSHSSIKMLKRKGPRTDPCATALVTRLQLE